MNFEDFFNATPSFLNDREKAIQFVRWCVAELGLGYHPDTPFGKYVDEQGHARFTSAEVRQLVELQGHAFEFCDPYEIGLAEFQRVIPELGMEGIMKGPIIYQDPAFQRELIRTGTREQIIDWLCWNDPNGTYTDGDCATEGIAITTLERAKECIRHQIMSDGTAIPNLSDRKANAANIAAIDSLVQTQKYPYIVAWGKWLGFKPETVLKIVRAAEVDNAPENAIQKIDDRWTTLDDIQNETNRQRVIDLAANNEPAL